MSIEIALQRKTGSWTESSQLFGRPDRGTLIHVTGQSSFVMFSNSRALFNSTCVYATTASFTCLEHPGNLDITSKTFCCRHVWRWSTLHHNYSVIPGVVDLWTRHVHCIPGTFVSIRIFLSWQRSMRFAKWTLFPCVLRFLNHSSLFFVLLLHSKLEVFVTFPMFCPLPLSRQKLFIACGMGMRLWTKL